MRSLAPAICLLLVAASPSSALTMLFDFETDGDIKAWKVRSPEQDTLDASAEFATSGKRSAVLQTPKWKKGMKEWPAFEAKPPVKDWSKAKALLIDLTNPTDETQHLKLFISDSDTDLRQGVSRSFALGARSHHRAVIPVASFPKQVSRSDVAILHFYTARPEAKLVVHIDNIALLAPGEDPPPLPEAYRKQLVGMMVSEEDLRTAQAALVGLKGSLDALVPRDVSARGWFDAEVRKALGICGQVRRAYDSGTLTEQQARVIRDGMLGNLVARLRSLAELAKASAKQAGTWDCVIAAASSMEKVLPRDVPVSALPAGRLRIDLARNEKESVQVVVVPLAAPLKGVRVEVGELEGQGGRRIPAKCVDVRPVGYVKTAQPPYRVSHVGWWPDPLLDFVDKVDVAQGDAQSFWVRVRAPKDAGKGAYRGKVRIVSAGRTLGELDLEVNVYGFAMPDRSPLPTAMSVYTNFVEKFAGKDWAKVKVQLADFLADYYIDYDHLYRNGPPEWDILERLEKQGRLVAFNLRYFNQGPFKPGLSDAAFAKAFDPLAKSVGEILARAKKEGIADKAYFYGFDERGKEYFPVLQRIAAGMHKRFGDLKVMTTTYDHSFGLDSVIKDMDIWVPLTPRYDPVRAAKARKLGKEVWWYICCGPAHPYANWFVDYPAIETRLLMGMMTAKYRPDGFLYYAMTRWPNNTEPITSGPFTKWNPASYKEYNGDGSILCPGPGGRPLATIRLENFRDGLEDYAYVRILEATVRAKEAAGASGEADKAWLVRAKALLNVPGGVVKDLTHYTHDPSAVYDYRSRIARAIDEAGIRPVDPWRP
ncbi:MAG: DUF4091 domain-containing protein [Phycisphaerae bacterium]|nr:DUF4091 domain-containing protein [Phycisphaerae bacterium]